MRKRREKKIFSGVRREDEKQRKSEDLRETRKNEERISQKLKRKRKNLLKIKRCHDKKEEKRNTG